MGREWEYSETVAVLLRYVFVESSSLCHISSGFYTLCRNLCLHIWWFHTATGGSVSVSHWVFGWNWKKGDRFFWVIQTHNIPVSSLFTAPVGFNKIFGINRELKKERRSGVDWNVFRRFRSGRVFCFYKRSSLHKQTLFRINAATDFFKDHFIC